MDVMSAEVQSTMNMQAAAAFSMSSQSSQQQKFASSSDEQCRDDQLTLELQPAYTPLDEMKDVAALSIPDIVSLQSDLHGITVGMSGLDLTNGGSADQARRLSASAAEIARLDEEMSRLPASQTSSYRQALVVCPDLVTDERKVAFLECENNDAALAAIRLAKYWEARLEIFGPDRCFLPMALHGAMQDEVSNMLNRKVQQLLTVTDTAGRAIIYINPSRRNFDEYSVEQECMVTWYLLEAAAEDPEVRGRGAVFLSDSQNMQRRHYSRRLQALGNIVLPAQPIRTRAFHLCFPSMITNYVIEPVIRRFARRDQRMRYVKHYGSPDEVLRNLEGYCLPRDRLPTELGGTVVLDMNQWIMDRLALERSRLTEGRGPVVDQTVSPSTKRIRRGEVLPEISEGFGQASTCSAVTSSCGSSHTQQLSEGEDRREPSPSTSISDMHIEMTDEEAILVGYVTGRKADPRMNIAVILKLRTPDMNNNDVLAAAGFRYPVPTANDKKETETLDEEGVSLRQRKNQLNRRFRKLKPKYDKTVAQRPREQQQQSHSHAQQPAKDERKSSSVTEQTHSQECSQEDLSSNALTRDMPNLLPPRSSGEQAVDATKQDDAMSDASDDSFLDRIGELPGLDGLENEYLHGVARQVDS